MVCFWSSRPWATLKACSPYLQGSPFHHLKVSGHVIWTTEDCRIQSTGYPWSACKLAGFVALQTHTGHCWVLHCEPLHFAGICLPSQMILPGKCFIPIPVGLLLCFHYIMVSRFCICWGFEFFNLSLILMSSWLSLSISLIDALFKSMC